MAGFYNRKTAPAGLSLSEAVEIVECLTLPEQRVLMDVLRRKMRPLSGAEALATAGLVEDLGRGSVGPSASLHGCARRLLTYLMRKFENSEYFDPDAGEMVPCPHGAEYVATVDACTGASGGWEFPADDVTVLLDFYGVNRCRGWKP